MAHPGEPAHDDYGMSSAKRWTSCLASVRMNSECPPSQDDEWGDDGKLAHALGELCLMFRERNALQYVGCDKINDLVGLVTTDMARAVQQYLDHVYDLLDRYPDAQLSVENRVKVPSAVVPNRMGGTLDCRIYVPSIAWLFIIDYKHGVGIFVSEEDNLQMRGYALASIFNITGPIVGVTTTIVQPRSFVAGGAIRDDHMTVAELLTLHVWFEERATLTLDPNAPYAPSYDNCRYCPAAGYGTCPAAWKNIGIVQTMMSAGLADGKRMSFEAMNWLMSKEREIKAVLANARSTATGFVRNGGDFPGWKMALAQAERAWYGKPADIAAQLAVLLGVPIEDVMPPTLITITEAENRVVDTFRSAVNAQTGETKKAFKVRQNEASEMAREALALLTLKEPRGAPRLVPLSDPRPALNTAVPHLAGQLNVTGL